MVNKMFKMKVYIELIPDEKIENICNKSEKSAFKMFYIFVLIVVNME